MSLKISDSQNAHRIKIFLAQINSCVGDLQGNFQKIFNSHQAAEELGCDLIIFPEMAICGYPCLDLWQKPYFIESCQQEIGRFVSLTKNSKTAAIIGTPIFEGFFENFSEGQIKNNQIGKNKKFKKPYNAAIMIDQGKISNIAYKKALPNYGVFDEARYFEAANSLSIFEFRGLSLAMLICEDMWDLRNQFLLGERAVDAILVINSSPFEKEKHEQRLEIAEKIVANLNKPLIYLNQIGGQDSLVFDGNSLIFKNSGKKVLQMKAFAQDFMILNLEKSGEIQLEEISESVKQKLEAEFSDFNSTSSQDFQDLETSAKLYNACVLGLRDYFYKNNVQKALLGLSGGIDSALVACIAVDALEAQNVSLYALPTRFNPESSLLDARNCAKNLTANYQEISIDGVFELMSQTLKLTNQPISNLALENLQARIRGTLLMSLSNSSAALLLSTSNKSEISCGYGTLYGDMCGAFNPIKDLYKTEIYQLANWRNSHLCAIAKNSIKSPIPASIIQKEPSAELAHHQKDRDSLPPYEILDQILKLMIEEQNSVEQIIANGFENALVLRVAKLFFGSEFKRQQSVLGPKLSKRSFDRERRYPISNHFQS